MLVANSIISSKYFLSVPSCAITSAVFLIHIVFAKWSDKYFSGLPVYLANIDGNRVEELVTITVFSSNNGAKVW